MWGVGPATAPLLVGGPSRGSGWLMDIVGAGLGEVGRGLLRFARKDRGGERWGWNGGRRLERGS